MDNLTRRRLLKTSGTTALASGLVVGSAGTASATCDCNTGDCSHCGDIVKVTELNGNGTASYEITVDGGCIYDCFPDTYDGTEYIGNDGSGMCWASGVVSNDTDKWLISGSGLYDIRVCDVDDPGAQFSVEVQKCPDHCAYGYSDYGEVNFDQLLNSETDSNTLCSEYGTGEAYYDFCMTGDVESYAEVESEDGEYWGSCAEGYLRNGDADYWVAYGRFESVYVEPGGSNVYVGRSASDDCVSEE